MVKWMTTQSGMEMDRARQGYYERGNQPQPEKALTLDQIRAQRIAELAKTDPEKADRLLFPQAFKEEKRPANITGAPDYESLIGGRVKAAENAQAEYDAEQNRLKAILHGTMDQEREGAATPREETEDEFGRAFDVSENPILKSALDALAAMGERPAGYKRPFGTEATALMDSSEASRQDPNILSALLDFDPGKVTQKEDPIYEKVRAMMPDATDEEIKRAIQELNANR
jgi:hypothetical protein